MKKKLLLQLPLNKASDVAVDLAKLMTDETTKYIVSAAIKIIDHKKTLVLDFYDRELLTQGYREISYRSFITKEDHLTADFTSGGVKWRTGTIYTVTGERWWWGRHPYICQNIQSRDTIFRYLKASCSDPFDGINRMQQKILAKRLEARHRKITDPIDAQMKRIPKLPRWFHNWVDREVMAQSKYIFYDYQHEKKTQKGYCTWCHHEVELHAPRYGQEGICPHCGATAVFKTEKKAGTFYDYNRGAIIQKLLDGIVVRRFEVKKRYIKGNHRKPEYSIFEYERTIFDEKGKAEKYAWLNFAQKGYRWCYGKYYWSDGTLYTNNFKEIFKSTPWQYSHIYSLAKHGTLPTEITTWLYYYAQNPYVEYLYKLGLTNLADRVLNGYSTSVNENGKTITEILGVKKQYIPLLRGLNATHDQLENIQIASNLGLNLSLEEYQRLENKFGYRTQSILELSEYTTLHRIMKYLDKQTLSINKNQKNKLAFLNVTGDWIDYVKGCEALDYDLKNEFVLYPKHLQESHDLILERARQKREAERKAESEKLEAESREYFADLAKRYDWSKSGMMVRMPASMSDIIEEGQKQHHCVGEYAENAAKGKTTILFIRKESNPDTPYYTMETNY